MKYSPKKIYADPASCERRAVRGGELTARPLWKYCGLVAEEGFEGAGLRSEGWDIVVVFVVVVWCRLWICRDKWWLVVVVVTAGLDVLSRCLH